MKLTIPFLIRNSSFDFLYKNYKIIEYVGKGQFGNTYKVENVIDKKIWLAKCIDLSQMDEEDKKRSLQEAEIMKNINNPYVIKCHESFIHDDVYLVIIMEYCKQGDIGNIIDSCIRNHTFLSEEIILKWCSQLAAGLYYLHNECRIIHRDIKPSNIFITESGNIVIGDFGISRVILSVSMPFTLTSIGTPQYMSPEMCENKPYTYKSDIWSFGCVLYELTTLKPPFSGDSLLSLAWNISFHDIEPLPNCYSKDLFVLIKRLLSRDPILRPNPIEILSNKLFEKHRDLLLFLPDEIYSLYFMETYENEMNRKEIKKNRSEDKETNFYIEERANEGLMDIIGEGLNLNAKNEIIEFINFPNNKSTKIEKLSTETDYGINIYNEAIIDKGVCLDTSTVSISTSSTFSINSQTKQFENNLINNNQTNCDRLSNYEHQYFSVLVGRIQHHIISFIESIENKISTKSEMLNFLFLNLKCCNSIDVNCTNMTALWFSEFAEELNIGISEMEKSLFLSYIGYFVHSQTYLDIYNNNYKRVNSKIRHTKSSESLTSLTNSKIIKDFDISLNTDLFEEDSQQKNSIFYENGFNNKNQVNEVRLPTIYDFIEKISSWNKIKINNKLNEIDLDENIYRFNKNSRTQRNIYSKEDNKENSESISLPTTPKINEKNSLKISGKPYFYLFITDWIQSILKPILVLQNNQKVTLSQRKFKKITLREGFHLFDQKNNGVLSRQHFRTVLYLILPKLTSLQLDWLFALAPKDTYGNVKYEQFLEFIDNIQQNDKSTCNNTYEKYRNENNEDNRYRNIEFSKFKNVDLEKEKKTIYKVNEEMVPGTIDISYEMLDEIELNYSKFIENSVRSKSMRDQGQNDDSDKEQDSKESLMKNYSDHGIREELYSYGIQDVVLLHSNSQTYLRPSPSPQLLSRTRNHSFIRNSSNIINSESLYKNSVESKNSELKSVNASEINTHNIKREQETKQFQKIEYNFNSISKDENIQSSIQNEILDESCTLETVLPIKLNNFTEEDDLSMSEVNLNIKEVEIPDISSFTNKKVAILMINTYLEKLIQTLQIEMLYTCWTTAKAPENNVILYSGIMESLKNIRYDTSEALDKLITYLSLFEKEIIIKRNLSSDIFESIFELKNILLILKIELPLQRDAIDCILKIIDDVKFSNEESMNSISQTDSIQKDSKKTSSVYKQIMKQAITNNIVLPISGNKYGINNNINKGRLNYMNSQTSSVCTIFNEEDNSIEKILEENKLNIFHKKNGNYKNVHDKLVSISKDFDWTGKFLASFEFFGETTVNLIQYAVNILSLVTQTKEVNEGTSETKKDFSQSSYLIENYRQWSYLKEHVSRECAFVASIGVNYNLKNDLETARIFLELLGARRYQATVTLQQQSLSEQKLFRELFMLEESLWNNQKFLGHTEDSTKQKTDSEHWLIKGEQTCIALHNTCIKFVDEIKLIIESSQDDIFAS